jgi:hypothetical protein
MWFRSHLLLIYTENPPLNPPMAQVAPSRTVQPRASHRSNWSPHPNVDPELRARQGQLAAGRESNMEQLRLNVYDLLESRKFVFSSDESANHALYCLDLIAASGAPPMRVLSLEALELSGSLPHSDRDLTVDARDALCLCGANTLAEPFAVFVFVSHRWLRPTENQPDDATGSKHEALVQFGKWLQRERGLRLGTDARVFFWLDWTCIDQNEPAAYTAALPLYMAACSRFAVYQTDGWDTRAWCRLERLLAFTFMMRGKEHLVFGPNFKNVELPYALIMRESVPLLDPATGAVTKPADMSEIRALTAIALRVNPYTAGQELARMSCCAYTPHCEFPGSCGNISIFLGLLGTGWLCGYVCFYLYCSSAGITRKPTQEAIYLAESQDKLPRGSFVSLLRLDYGPIQE